MAPSTKIMARTINPYIEYNRAIITFILLRNTVYSKGNIWGKYDIALCVDLFAFAFILVGIDISIHFVHSRLVDRLFGLVTVGFLRRFLRNICFRRFLGD